VKGGPVLPFPTFPFPYPLEVDPLKPARGLGERCKLPQQGPGQSPSRKRIWCALKLSLVAVILNILRTMFYVVEEINWR